MNDIKSPGFKVLLDEKYEWPCQFRFKFIVPKGNVDLLKETVGAIKTTQRPSKKGTYVSVSFFMEVSSSDHVIEIYEKAAKVPGLVAL